MPIHVMYLDDESELCDIFSETFGSDEIVITTFVDANKAIEFSHKNSPDIIFVDYRLVGTNGDLAAQVMPSHIPKYLVTREVKVTTTYNFIVKFTKPYDCDGIAQVIQSIIIKKAS